MGPAAPRPFPGSDPHHRVPCDPSWKELDAPLQPNVATVRFPVAMVQDLCKQSSGKLIGTPYEFGTRVIDTKDMQHG